MGKNNRPVYAKFAFYTFIIAAIVYLIQAVLSFANIGLEILDIIQGVVVITLFVLVGIAGWQYCKNKSFIYKLLYFISVLVILVAVVLPVF